jgi:hypothetical protein
VDRRPKEKELKHESLTQDTKGHEGKPLVMGSSTKRKIPKRRGLEDMKEPVLFEEKPGFVFME